MDVGDLIQAVMHLSATTPVVVEVPDTCGADVIFGELDRVDVIDFNGDEKVAYLVTAQDADERYHR